jgi:hypothetical protein
MRTSKMDFTPRRPIGAVAASVVPAAAAFAAAALAAPTLAAPSRADWRNRYPGNPENGTPSRRLVEAIAFTMTCPKLLA